MLSSVINSLRVFKGLYDLAFSEDRFYVDPPREWDHFDKQDRKYLKANYPDDYKKYFVAFEHK
jgi:hypothetical protein